MKDMVYDSLHYASQVEEAARSHRREDKKIRKDKKIREDKARAKECGLEEGVTGKKLSSGEYLKGFYKEDKLIPVITLVVYFGPDKWDAPVCLHEMLSGKRKINQRIEKILQFLYTVIRTANILIYIVPEQSAMTFLFQGANSARAVSVILVLGRRSSR